MTGSAATTDERAGSARRRATRLDAGASIAEKALTTLAVAGGAAAIVARVAIAPAALEAAESLALAAPWIAAGVAVLVGALAFRAHRARVARAGTPRAGLVGPDVAAFALGPVAAGVGTWFLVAAGVPLLVDRVEGAPATTAARVVARVEGTSLGCPYRVVLASDALPHPMEACVDLETWVVASAGAPLAIDTLRSRAGLELRAVRPGVPAP